MGPKARQITCDIYQVGGPGLTVPDDAAAYLVATADEAALIDTGTGQGTDLLLANVEAAGVPAEQIRWILLTHCHYDHAGGARELRRRLCCPVVAHGLDAGAIESADDDVTAASWYGRSMPACPVDVRLDGDGDFPVGHLHIQAIPIPGHSPGSVAYLTRSEGKTVLFAQDVHGPLHPSLLSCEPDYLASLRLLLSLGADVLCEGHFGVFEGQDAVGAFIHRFLDP